MASIKKRGKRYYIKFKRRNAGIVEERLFSLGTNWKEVAYDLKRKLEKLEGERKINPFDPAFDLDAVLNPNKKKSNIPATIGEAIDLWLQTKKKLSPDTYKTYKSRLNVFQDVNGCKNMAFSKLSVELIEKYIFRDGVSATSAKSDAKHLSVFLNYLVKKGWIDHNLINGIDIPEGNVEYFKKMLRENEYHLLMETFDKVKKQKNNSSNTRNWHMQPWFKAMLSIYFYGGFRLHEIAYRDGLEYSGLKLENIIEDGRLIHLPPTKGRKERFVPVSKHIRPLLDAYLDIRKAKKHTDYIFIHFSGTYKGKPVTGEAFRNAFKYYCKAAEIPASRTPHGLRHQRITNWLQNGFSMKEAADMAGHSSTRITESTYTHLAYNSLLEKFERLEGEE